MEASAGFDSRETAASAYLREVRALFSFKPFERCSAALALRLLLRKLPV